MHRHMVTLFATLLLFTTLHSYTIMYIQETPQTTEIEISLQDIEISEGINFTQIELPNALHLDDPQSPDIPFITLRVAVPESADISVNIQPQDTKTASLTKPLQPVGKPSTTEEMTSTYTIDPQKYTQTRSLYQVTGKQMINHYDFIPVHIYPIKYTHSQNKIEYPERLLVTINIIGAVQRNTPPPLLDDKDIYADLFINSKYASAFTIQRDKTYHTSGFTRGAVWYRMEIPADGMYVLDNQNLPDAIYRDADPRQIRIFSTGGAMMFPDFDNGGNVFEEIPIYQIGGSSGSFDAQTKLIFYATQRDGFGKNLPLASYTSAGALTNLGDYITLNPYSKNGVYWLTWSSKFVQPPKRMVTQPPLTANTIRTTGKMITHKEENNTHISDYNESGWDGEAYGFDWFMKNLNNSDSASFTENFADIDTTKTQSISFVAKAHYQASSSNFVRLTVNGKSINLSLTSYNITKQTSTDKYLHEGSNTFAFTSGGSTRKLLKSYTIEWQKNLIKRDGALRFQIANADISSPRRYSFSNSSNQTVTAFQIDDFHSVKILPIENSSFAANGTVNTYFYVCSSSDYQRPTNIALANTTSLANILPHDISIIYPSEFAEGATRLASLYQIQGYSARTFRLEDVYDNFSGGHPDPVAIRNFLHYVQLDKPKHLRSLGTVFIGSGTFDYRNFSGTATARNKFPINQLSFYANEDNSNRQYRQDRSSDDIYAHFNTFRYPEIIVGRIPCKTSQELGYYLDKLETYIKNPQAGWWQYTVQMIADDFNYRSREEDTDHTIRIERLGNIIKNYVFVDKLFAQEYPLNPLKRKPNVKNLLVDKVNEGRLYWIYFGHGSIRNCGDEQYFSADLDLALLNNRDKYPIFLAASCNIGQYDMPSTTSLCEELVLRRNAGTIASIGATRKTFGSGNSALFEPFMEISINRQQTMLGKAFVKAKVATQGQYSANYYYNILGDPFLNVAYPKVTNNLSFTEDTPSGALPKRQTVSAVGGFKDALPNERVANTRVYDNGKAFTLYPSASTTPNHSVTQENLPIFNGSSRITDSQYVMTFIIPDDAMAGRYGKIFSMAINESGNRKIAYLDRKTNIEISDTLLDKQSAKPPEITIYLDSKNFKDGDTVSNSPTLYAEIKDDDGLNTIGNPGKTMMIRVDSSTDVISASSGFTYDDNSHTSGTLVWKLNDLPDGKGTVEVVAYDSFNVPAVARATFNATRDVKIAIKDALVYPNPVRSDCHFTFVVSHEANIIIDIYTITGRKIKTIRAYNQRDFTMIPWNGRDDDGDRIANNTYFYKIKASAVQGRGSDEVTEKLVILR